MAIIKSSKTVFWSSLTYAPLKDLKSLCLFSDLNGLNDILDKRENLRTVVHLALIQVMLLILEIF